MAPAVFDHLFDRVRSFLQGRELFVCDAVACADPRHELPVRLIADKAWHALFTQCLLRPAQLDSRELAAKGWTQVESGGDVSIVAMEITRNQQTLNTFYDGFGGGWGWRRFGAGGFGEATTTTETYKVGTVVVDLFDAKTKQLIWRGAASDTLSNNSDKNIKNLDKGVDKMFKHFPPGSSKK